MFSFLTDFFDSGRTQGPGAYTPTSSVPLPSTKPSPSDDRLTLANSLELVRTGVNAVGSIWGGFASNESSQTRAGILRYNAATYRQSANEILEVGDFNAEQIRFQTREMIGRQRAALAANGIVLDQDTAADLISETAGVGAVDALIVIANAEREAIQTMRRAGMQDLEAGYESRIGEAQIRRGFGEAAIDAVEGLQRINQRNEDFGGSNR